MSDLTSHPPLDVRRIQTDHGSHVEPAFDDSWDDLTKLRWQAGVVAADCGIRAYIITGACQDRLFGFGPWRDTPDCYGVSLEGRNGSLVGLTYRAMWDYLNGVSDGAETARAIR